MPSLFRTCWSPVEFFIRGQCCPLPSITKKKWQLVKKNCNYEHKYFKGDNKANIVNFSGKILHTAIYREIQCLNSNSCKYTWSTKMEENVFLILLFTSELWHHMLYFIHLNFNLINLILCFLNLNIWYLISLPFRYIKVILSSFLHSGKMLSVNTSRVRYHNVLTFYMYYQTTSIHSILSYKIWSHLLFLCIIPNVLPKDMLHSSFEYENAVWSLYFFVF